MLKITRFTNSPWKIWLIGVSFMLLQFFLQLSSGIVIGNIIYEMKISALTAGFLGSAFYIVYTALQIPVGILFDTRSTRVLLATSAFIFSMGCCLFTYSFGLSGLFMGRILIGMGASFAFVGLSHLLRQHFPLRRFAFMIGLSETLAFLASVVGMINMGGLLESWGWRGFTNAIALIAICIAFLCLRYIPNTKSNNDSITNYKQQIIKIIKNHKIWINGLYVGLGFTIVTVFGALWAIPFLQVKMQCSVADASLLGGFFYTGAALSCPLFGLLSIYLPRRKPMLLLSAFSTSICLLYVLYIPINSFNAMSILLFTIGTCCGAYMIAYTIANELAPGDSLSTCAGFTNTLAMMTAAVMQPVVGLILDVFSSSEIHTIEDYQAALLIIPIALLVAGMLVFYLPEKKPSIKQSDLQNEQLSTPLND